MRNKFLAFTLILSTLFILALTNFSCRLNDNSNSGDSLSDKFPDILNYKGIPQAFDDRSVFMFSDLGAWHGYALPPEDSKSKFAGSFVGPFIMTQDNGIWLSSCLAQMEIINASDGSSIQLDENGLVSNHSFPNKLEQVFKTHNPELLICSELIFVSNRSALIKVSVKNNGSKKQQISINWSGDIFDSLAEFQASPHGVALNFKENSNEGWLSFPDAKSINISQDGNTYLVESVHNAIKPGRTMTTYLGQSFCFDENEKQNETTFLKKVFEQPDAFFKDNIQRWNFKLDKIISGLSPEYNIATYQEIAVKCLQTLNNNWRSAAGLLKYDGLFPSYNYKWFNGFWSWDSWKHAVAIARYDHQLAKEQIQVMFEYQDAQGMIADCIYRDTLLEKINWRDTKPPLSAWAVWEVYKQSGDRKFLEELYPKILKYHHWWYRYRDADKNGLCEYGSTDGSLVAAKWESGMDNAVRFDNAEMIANPPFGGTINLESVDLNAYLYLEKKCIALMSSELGNTSDAKSLTADAEYLKEQIQEIFFDETEAWFFDVNVDTKKPLKAFGPEGWTPLFTEAASAEQAEGVRQTMIDPEFFASYIPFPTLAANHPDFRPEDGYWRGPNWIDQVYFAIRGLENYGYHDEAHEFTTQVLDRLEGLKNSDLPIRENYNPLTGEGLESKHFSWSAAHILLLMSEKE